MKASARKERERVRLRDGGKHGKKEMGGVLVEGEHWRRCAKELEKCNLQLGVQQRLSIRWLQNQTPLTRAPVKEEGGGGEDD